MGVLTPYIGALHAEFCVFFPKLEALYTVWLQN